MAQSRIVIDGMTCAHCERYVHDALAPLAGVTEVRVSAADGTAIVEHDEALDMDDVAAAVDDAGHTVRV